MPTSSSRIQVISIRDRVDKNLSLRIYASDFFKSIESLDQIEFVIDFDGVISVSRSFAQEFLNLMKTSRKHITIVNQPEEIKMIFNAVQNPRKKAENSLILVYDLYLFNILANSIVYSYSMLIHFS